MSDSLRTVLLVDGNRTERERLAVVLRKEIDCIVFEADNPGAALDLVSREDVCVLVTGLLPEKNGSFDLVKKVFQEDHRVVSLIGVPLGDREALVEALQLGAFFYLNVPYDLREAVIAVARALNHYDLSTYHEKRGLKFRKSEGFRGIIGNSPKMRELFDIIERVAEDGTSTVMIQGESGTGKELVARAVHAFSPRKVKNFVPINCAAIPDELLESELFGHLKGAFTGAIQSKIGRIQYADGGTLFLDEIGDMKPALQAKLLRVLQEKEFEPVGQVKPMSVDVRVIAATHRDLEKLVEEGNFREDLYYRLNVVPIFIPPLRERFGDIPLLLEKFTHMYNRKRKHRLRGFSADAVAALTEYPWPGNVRELENLVQRMAVFHGGKSIGRAELPKNYLVQSDRSSPSPPPAPETAGFDPARIAAGVDYNSLVSEFEDRLILQALHLTQGNKKEAARLLNLKRTTLSEKIKKKDLDRE